MAGASTATVPRVSWSASAAFSCAALTFEKTDQVSRFADRIIAHDIIRQLEIVDEKGQECLDLPLTLTQLNPACTEPELTVYSYHNIHNTTQRIAEGTRMARTTARVDGATLILPERDASPIPLDTPAWFAWLEHAATFAFTGPSGHFTARKERQARGGGYWKAYRTPTAPCTGCSLARPRISRSTG